MNRDQELTGGIVERVTTQLGLLLASFIEATQCFARTSAVSDVASDALHPHDLTLPNDWPTTEFQWHSMPILGNNLQFVVRRNLPGELALKRPAHQREILRSHNLGEVHRSSFRAPVACEFLASPIGRGEVPHHVHGENSIVAVLAYLALT